MILLVSYDLHNPNRDYDDVIETIKSASSWAHVLQSVWLIETSLSPETWVNKLIDAGDADDKIFVAQLKDYAAWRNISTNVARWINSDNRSW